MTRLLGKSNPEEDRPQDPVNRKIFRRPQGDVQVIHEICLILHLLSHLLSVGLIVIFNILFKEVGYLELI